ncbi:CHAP domain-containing protein [Belnapia sp. F-4-1]|uniref:CHAP domain-containing protein n=1 Tax=Belnapia sp. F-4-1 TaxID=1545443 RepID=UPI001F2C36D3|nr:CHAP domain-containing protein [Belnapia sp. F-4-1]
MHRTAMAWCVVAGALAASGDAMAAQRDQAQQRPGRDTVQKVGIAAHQAHAVRHRAASRLRTARRSQVRLAAAPAESGGISCVPYARAVTGMQVSGNGGDWWSNAAGLYDRGQRPEPGSVMAFRATGGMSRGHVAVVRRVVAPREVRIDHANWGGPGIRRGSVMQDVSVIDVSHANDWSEVRVQSGYNDNAFGRVYPTYGFIYNRPDDGVTAGTAYAGMQLHRSARYEQVAEMPDGHGARGYSLQGLAPLRTAQARTAR